VKLNFDFLVSTNGTLPSKNWKKLGPVTSLGDGQYRFTDGGATGQPKRFYLLREQYHAVSPAPAGEIFIVMESQNPKLIGATWN